MKTRKDFAPATPSEVRDVGFDYRNDVSENEVLASAEFTITLVKTAPGATVDSSPNSRKQGAADIEDGEDGEDSIVAVQRVAGLIAGNTYNIICRATTTNGQVLELNAHIACRDAA